MTPLAMEMLIWFHTRAMEAGPFHCIDFQPQQEILSWFLDAGVIEPYPGTSPQYAYRTTEKGAAWLSMALDTPMPKQVWIDPRKAA